MKKYFTRHGMNAEWISRHTRLDLITTHDVLALKSFKKQAAVQGSGRDWHEIKKMFFLKSLGAKRSDMNSELLLIE